ncbi:ABC transporter ATP-binding protein [Pseudactinotalea suaedae]|uniref:ABC transporter ATP-binding protein n=1 Tax=Pseudactinotalea suaedae TaxID=1524924 RepID=UPI0012E1B8C3|nr:ABC transporter ATP-binding protein [Pseudactinotalea suaedae]
MTSTAEPALDLAGVTKTFTPVGGDRVEAVRGIDLTIGRGEIVAFLGPNGAGKTTTLDMALGLTEPTSGTVRVYGQGARAAVLGGKVSAVLQSGGLLHDLSVRETVQVIASAYRAALPVDEAIERAGLTAIAGRRVSKCSGGEQQRLRFALALLPDPDLLILDEPTAGMDVGARHEFWATMRSEVSEGRTVVFATHYLEEADTFAERIVMMARGEVVADGPTTEIRARATGRTVTATLPPHRLEAAVQRLRATGSVTDVTTAGDRITIHAGDSDAVALLLLSELGGTGLEITTGSLDEAFLALTSGADRR